MNQENTERAVSTSISLEPSKMKYLAIKAIEKGYSSRNNLIYNILTDWVKKDMKTNK